MYFGGGRERHGDSGKKRAGASPMLRVKSVVGGARGIADWLATDFGVARGHTPFDGPTAALIELSVSEKRPMFTEIKKK